MGKDEVVQLILDTFVEDNLEKCIQFGMTPEQATEALEKSKPSLDLSFRVVYDKLKEKNIIA